MVSTVEFSLKEAVKMREVALAASFIAMVFISTSIFYIPLVSSTGFFNIGEAFVYLAALIGGPVIGALAGGIGAAMADMVLGYGTYAPATLILKGMEGFVAGLLYRTSRNVERKYRLLIVGLTTFSLMVFSIFVTTPSLNNDPDSSTINIIVRFLDLTLFIPHILGQMEDQYQIIQLAIPGLLIVVLAFLFCCLIWFIELKMGEKGHMILSCLLAGPIIVIGYFLYQTVILGIPSSAALTEVPFNIGQVIFGIAIAVPIVSYLRELGIIPDSNQNLILRNDKLKQEDNE
jgi:uncharacterized membrane protein